MGGVRTPEGAISHDSVAAPCMGGMRADQDKHVSLASMQAHNNLSTQLRAGELVPQTESLSLVSFMRSLATRSGTRRSWGSCTPDIQCTLWVLPEGLVTSPASTDD